MLRHVSFVLCAVATLVAVASSGCSEGSRQISTGEPGPDITRADTTAAPQGVIVTDPESRPTPPLTTVGVAYLSITNSGTSVDRLLSASSPVAAEVELHANSVQGTMTHMRPVEALELAPHQTVSMDPGGMHFMLTDLAAPLVAGEHFPLVLKFESAGEITVDVVVREDEGASQDAHQHDQRP